ncbi:alkylhydroperoxidase family enzyme [Nocardioides albertanoniae]|uniref:Alkylhydroperoxidase family enzyme n=1 Tax=Nocardioides albertanoniae TaxID=1175486 RepID=A0A543A5P1_9ACTN|nr:alkylhydroperoxidase family enzyme [Nocardioides albertanoniae]
MPSVGQERLYAADVADDGYVWDLTRLWAHLPEAKEQLVGLFASSAEAAGLTSRDRAVIVIAQAAAIGDSYCAVAWGRRLTDWTDPQTAIAALTGDEEPFSERERALADWARTVARSPGSTTPGDVQRLRDVGISDAQIMALTVFAGLRTAFSSINDALGARPDPALTDTLDPAVRSAIRWGRTPG